MKKLIVLFVFFISFYPTLLVAQKEYFNLDFEKTDTIGKSIVHWQYYYFGMGTKFIIDTTNAATGKNCLFIKKRRNNESGSYYIILPKTYYKGLRTIKISANLKMTSFDTPNAGIWFEIKKNKNVLPYSNYYHSSEKAIAPFSWTPYSMEETIEKDPDEVKIAIGVFKDRAWFDDIKIEINGKPVNDLVFEIEPEK